MGSAAGGARAGCAVFSVLGVLIAVVLTVWLGSKAMDGVGSSGRRGGADRTASTAGPDEPTAELQVAPASDLADGQQVAVRGTGYPAGATVRVQACGVSPGLGLVIGAASPCDDAATVDVVADDDGRIVAEVPVRRALTLGGVPFDCAAEPGFCALTATSADGSVRAADVPLTFAPA